MTENEAIKELVDYVAEYDKLTISFETVTLSRKALEEIQQYRAIGTIEEFKALKEKETPKKLIVKGVMGFQGEETYCCPNCGLDNSQWGCNRCVDCGQKLDWQ